MYSKLIVSTLAAWLAGLLLDTNIKFGPQGFLGLRVVLPVLATGLCILSAVKDNKNKPEK